MVPFGPVGIDKLGTFLCFSNCTCTWGIAMELAYVANIKARWHMEAK
jgi:hypothetical protein